MTIHEQAPAKINLFLHVVGRRPDGYHELDTLFAFTDFGDKVEVSEGHDLSFAMQGEFADRLVSENDNLVLKAARVLAQEAGLPSARAQIVLHKNIPVAAGLGGGSADAAATLRALNQLWGLNYTLDRLATLGLRLGADVPACVYSTMQWGQGIGDQLTPLTERIGWPILLVNPRTPLSTAHVFQAFAASGQPFQAIIPDLTTQTMSLPWLKQQTNSLEDAALSVDPQMRLISASMANLQGTCFVRMAGSGPTWFAVFEDAAAASAAAKQLAQAQPGWWVVNTHLQY